MENADVLSIDPLQKPQWNSDQNTTIFIHKGILKILSVKCVQTCPVLY